MEAIKQVLGLSKKQVEKFRQVYINEALRNAEQKFPGNHVRTTRYTLINFLPKNLFEQFRRLANVYFLLIAMLQVFTSLSPTGRYTTIGPLVLILTVSAIKEAIEDFARYKSDVITNNRPLDILDIASGNWIQRPWKSVVVGDIVRVKNKEYFPADLLLLSSSEAMGMVYVETSSLDGETNLKIRQAIMETNDPLTANCTRNSQGVITDMCEDTTHLRSFRAYLECEAPNNRINDFEGALTYNDKKFSLTNTQILLRGAQLKQTRWAVGCVVFSGYHTKVVMNSTKAPSKRSNIERRTNDFIIVILTLMGLLCLTSAVAAVVWGDDKMDRAWYLPDGIGSQAFVQTFATYLILLATMVPISLYVTMEVVKMFQAFHINWDLEMYDEETDTPALCRSSGLNEELGQVEYIFSDKTGTLTQNLMEFRKCTVGGTSYGKGLTEIGRAAAKRAGKEIVEDTDPNWLKPDPMFNFQDPSLLANMNDPNHPEHEQIRDFLYLLSLCHTVIPEGTIADGNLAYQAASPDEAALVAAAKCLGFVFHQRSPKSVEVMIDGNSIEYQILNIIEFNSDRKRMTVILRNPEGQIVLYTKGADTKIFERLVPNQPNMDITLKYLEGFATEGLRTLCCAKRTIPEDEWREWNDKYEQATTSLVNRQKMIDDAAELIETNLTLIGTTAIEDKLQDGVPDTIASLARANIKIWVLTGDKQETAINIGFACALLSEDMVLMILNEPNAQKTAEALDHRWNEYTALDEFERTMVAMIIDGKTLEFILSDDKLRFSFLELGKRCKAVVCCRVTPKQKADVTLLVKVYDKRICLAIGDGANDVAMIQAAHVGVGISGREGLQAVQSSDYAIAQFRFLKKLLLGHGHWNYRRISRVITYNFYKNICLYMTQFWFGLYNMVSGQSMYESWTQSAFNLFFTSLPIIAYGILDQDVMLRGVYTFPSIYTIGQRKKLFNARMFAYWLCNALAHSVVCFLIPLFHSLHVIADDGLDRGSYGIGMIMYTGVVYVCCFKVFIMTRTHNIVTIGSIILSIIAWYVWLGIYQYVLLDRGNLTNWMLGNFVMGIPSFWLVGTILVPVVALSRDFAWRAYKDNFLATPVVYANWIAAKGKWDEIDHAEAQRVKQRDAHKQEQVLAHNRKASTVQFLRKSQSGLGFAFAASDRDQYGQTEWDRLKQAVSSKSPAVKARAKSKGEKNEFALSNKKDKK